MKEKNITLGDQYISYLNFESSDSKENVLILHGWGGKSESWKSVGEILSQNGYNVYIPDLPGFGNSPIEKVYTLEAYAALVEDFVNNLGLEIKLLLGHSNGGAISSTIVSRGNMPLEKLILNNSAGVRANPKRRLKRCIMKPFVYIFKLFSFLPFYQHLRKGIYRFIGGSDYIQAEKQNPFLKATYLNVIEKDITKSFHSIRIPTLLLWGERDTYTPVSDGGYIRLNIKDSIMETIQGQGHSIHLSNPIILTKHILKYLKH